MIKRGWLRVVVLDAQGCSMPLNADIPVLNSGRVQRLLEDSGRLTLLNILVGKDKAIRTSVV